MKYIAIFDLPKGYEMGCACGKMINQEKRHINLYCVEGICRESEEMAIKALEQEPCEDAVSRKVLLKIYEDRFIELQKMKHLKDFKGANDIQLGVNYCINILKELPPVHHSTPNQKTGHWIEKYHEVFKHYCDKCGTGSDLRTNFCSNCGAKMKGKSEEV